jgi:hypothetical protein
VASKPTWGQSFKKHGKSFALGTLATMAFSYVFEKLGSGKSSAASKEISTPPAIPAAADTPNLPNTANNPGYSTSPNPSYSNPSYSTSPNPSYSNPSYSTSPNPSYSDPSYSTSPNPSYSTSTYPTTQTQNGYQRRTVDRDLSADIFGEHLESWFIDNIVDGIVILSGSSEARSISDNNKQNR